MGTYVDLLKNNPVGLLSEEILTSKEPLSAVRSYFDDVIRLTKLDGSTKTTLDEIVVDGMDANQVWWQSKIILDNMQSDLMDRISAMQTSRGAELSDRSDEDSDGSEEDHDSEVSDEDVDENLEGSVVEEEAEDATLSEAEALELHEDERRLTELSSEDEKFEEAQETQEEITDKYGVNDKFFNLEEFNRQTLEAENNINNLAEEDDEDIDLFADMPSEDDDEEAVYYDDFFDQPTDAPKPKSSSRPVKKATPATDDESFDESEYDDAMEEAKLDLFAEDEDDLQESETETMKQPLSSFERQQLEIQRQIESLEKEAVAEKKWALKGEVKARDRPEDALLTEDLEFERTAKPVPVITSEVTETLENMIRRRIKEEDFNDLQRRIISDVTGYNSKPRFELSDVKSSKSLAEIYEDDYNGNTEDTEISEELQKSHNEISELFKNLAYKLDALSSAHFIPKPITKDLEVRVQSAAISMEDAQPLTMSSAATLAPQEIYKVGKSENPNEITLKNGTVMSREELSREDKNRLRRAAKRKRSKLSSQLAETKSRKKSKKDDVLETLSKSKNITVIDKKGTKTDVKGNLKKDTASGSTNLKL